MPRGQADFGQYAVKEVSASISDMGEVAARLGSIVTYDKRGDVIDFDNFEEPVLKWFTAVVGSNSYIRLANDNAKSGCQAAKLYAGPVIDAECWLRRILSCPTSLSVGFEVSFSYQVLKANFSLLLESCDGTVKRSAYVKLDPVAQKLYILDSTGISYKEVATIDPYPELFTFHTLKLVANFEAGYYNRLLFDDKGYDISSEALASAPFFTTARFLTEIWLANQIAEGSTIWVDDVIWTQAEP